MDFGKVARALLMLALLLPLLWWASGCAPLMAQARYGRETEASAVRAQVAADVLLLHRQGCAMESLQAALEAQGVARDESTRRALAAWTLGAGLCPGARKE